jgi:hypothetical protein
LPPESCYVAFDDGFNDHFKYVLPELLSRSGNIQGSFFPPAGAVMKREMLDEHALHFILESTTDYVVLVNEINTTYLAPVGSITSIQQLKNTWAIKSKYDAAEVMHIKNMLQHALSLDIRSKIVTSLSKKYLG